MNSILVGICILLGGYTVGGIARAVFFSVGLLAILNLNLDLFTRRCGKLSSIWLENFFGSFLTTFWRSSGV